MDARQRSDPASNQRVFPVRALLTLCDDRTVNGFRPLLRRAVVALTLAFAFATLLVHAAAGAPIEFLVLETTLGTLFVVAGLVAWERRPEALTGPILTLSGALWFAGSYALTPYEPVAGIAWSFERYYDPLLAFLALSFPARRIPSSTARLLVGALLVAFLVRTAFRLAFVCGCAPGPIAALDDEAVVGASDALSSLVIVALALGIAALAGRRAMSATPAARAVLRPVAAAGVLASLSAAYDAAELAYGRIAGQALNTLPVPWDAVFAWSFFVAVALVPIGFLLGALRTRLRHGAIAPLALELDRASDSGNLERALRHALGDPSLKLLTKSRDSNDWRDSSGATLRYPALQHSRAITKLDRDGDEIAILEHDEALREDPGLIAAATAVLRLAIENERLTADVRAQLEEVRASRARLVEAAHAERKRIERDLHDGAQQRLVSVALKIQEASAEARRGSPLSPFVQRLDEASDELKSAVDELRELARGIHPAVLTEEGLGVAIAALARRSSVPVELDININGRLPAAVEATGYYVVAEALTNVSRHSRARSANVRIARRGDNLHVEIADDGTGGTDVAAGSGLRGLADRLDAVAGRLEIDSPSGGGTRLTAVIPCA